MKNGWTPLLAAADNGNFEAAKLLVQEGADINKMLEKNARMSVTMAALHDHLEMVKFMVDNGADVTLDPDGLSSIIRNYNTPIMSEDEEDDGHDPQDVESKTQASEKQDDDEGNEQQHGGPIE